MGRGEGDYGLRKRKFPGPAIEKNTQAGGENSSRRARGGVGVGRRGLEHDMIHRDPRRGAEPFAVVAIGATKD